MPTSFSKREREKKLQERAEQKRQRRAERAEKTEQPETGQVDEAAMMERYRILSEAREAGTISQEDYEAERLAIFTELGLADSLT